MISYFYNHEGEYYLETIESLKELKQDKIIKLLKKLVQIHFKGIVPKDIEKRNEIINGLPDGKYKRISEKIDQKFYKYENKLESDLVKYIIENVLV